MPYCWLFARVGQFFQRVQAGKHCNAMRYRTELERPGLCLDLGGDQRGVDGLRQFPFKPIFRLACDVINNELHDDSFGNWYGDRVTKSRVVPTGPVAQSASVDRKS